MEEDIVKRLRDPRWVKYNPEAADEIEKLRRLVESHRKWREMSDKFDQMVNKDWSEECERLQALHPANIDYILVNGVRTDMRDVQIVYREVKNATDN